MPARILIVEDDRPIAANLQALLTAKGYEVFLAHDGHEGLAQARDKKPDLALLDILLPELGGFEICEILKSEPETKKIKIVMITALERFEDIEEALQHGADDYLIKPFNIEQVLKKMRKLLPPDHVACA